MFFILRQLSFARVEGAKNLLLRHVFIRNFAKCEMPPVLLLTWRRIFSYNPTRLKGRIDPEGGTWAERAVLRPKVLIGNEGRSHSPQ